MRIFDIASELSNPVRAQVLPASVDF